MKIAFLIIDMQQLFLDEIRDKVDVKKACVHINYVADLLRAKNHCIVNVYDMESATEENAEQMKLIPEIEIHPTDLSINKQKSNAFWETDLEDVLKKEKVDLVIISGFSALHCVLFTYNGAIERGFNTVLLQNGFLGPDARSVEELNRERHLISYPVIECIA